MEMMIVLTIVAIVAAASAPMVNKKMVRAASDKSPWVFVNGNGESIAYNIDNTGGIQDRKTATIGTNGNVPNGAGTPRLYIDTNSDTTPHILFGRQKNNLMRLIAGGERNNVWLSDVEKPNNISRSVTIGAGANGRSTNSVAIGAGATAGVSSIAIGSADGQNGPDARGNGSIAMMDRSAASGVCSVAVGHRSTASALNAIAFGRETSAQGQDAVAFGREAQALTTGSIAIGALTRGRHDNSIAIGTNAETRNFNTIAIGQDANAFATGSIAMGRNASAIAQNSIAIGHSSENGVQTQANAANSIAIGHNANAAAVAANGISIGENTFVSAANAVAIGRGARASASNSMAFGINANSSATNAIAIGNGAIANQTNTIVLGDLNTRVVIPGTVEFTNLVVRNNASIVNDLYVGGRTVLGLRLHGYKQKSAGQRKGDTSLIWGSYIADDNEDHGTWVHDGGHSGHRRWQFGTVIRVENQRDQQVFWNADRYDDEKRVCDHGDIRNITRNAFRTFYAAIGESLPSDFPSDRRLKNVGKEFKAGLAELKKLDLYNYTYKEDKNKTPRVGVMAQDLQKIFPDAVIKGEDGFLRIRMEDMFYAVINAVKELDIRTSAQEKKIQELEKRIEELEKKIK